MERGQTQFHILLKVIYFFNANLPKLCYGTQKNFILKQSFNFSDFFHEEIKCSVPNLVVHSRPIPGKGTGMKNCIPNYWERERECRNSFPAFGNGNGNEKSIPNFREREWEASIHGNGREREFPLTPALQVPFQVRGHPVFGLK